MNKLFWIILFLLSLAACKKVTLVVNDVPENTPGSEPIYVTGNFNYWDPGDERFRMNRLNDSLYQIRLPRGVGKIEYKFTRGDWSTQETDECGRKMGNRFIGLRESDTVFNRIDSWLDLDPLNCPQITIMLTDLPEDTPEDEEILIAGTFNEWNPRGDSFKFKKDSLGNRYVTIPRPSKELVHEFQIIRSGPITLPEADVFGHEIPLRELVFGKEDTMKLEVVSWKDQRKARQNELTIILEDIPQSTRPEDDIYMAANINTWYPRSPEYKFERDRNGRLSLTIPRKNDDLFFKITRGDWSSVEVDAFGFEIPNRYFSFQSGDSILYIDVKKWKDRSDIREREYTFVITGLPPNTPDKARIYLSGNFNGWKARDRKYQLKQNDAGLYEITLSNYMNDFEFKFTRGSWKSQEVDEKGQIIDNRHFRYTGQEKVSFKIDHWMDLPPEPRPMTIILDSIPAYSPEDADIYLASSFNGWNPGDPSQILRKQEDGTYKIRVEPQDEEMQFKFTRGNWGSVEGNADGYEIGNRTLRFGFADTVHLHVESWKDLHFQQ